MSVEALRENIRKYLKPAEPPESVIYNNVKKHQVEGYERSLIQIEGSEGDVIPAYLLIPRGPGPYPAVQVHHQHAGERHLGKSEVCGLAGDPRQSCFSSFG